MSQVKKAYLKQLKPYLVGERPRANGEWDMHCPLHEDDKRSANLNVQKGVWNCHRGCGGGQVSSLIARRAEWIEPPSMNGHGPSMNGKGSDSKPKEKITEAKIAGWLQNLQADEERLQYLTEERGLDNDTILDYEIGWDRNRNVYAVPVRGPQREIWNIRRYDPDPNDERRKIFSVGGMGSPARLYPISILTDKPEEIVICEGEFDALVTIQAGFPAITKTSSAKTWDNDWNEHFRDKVVYICNDMDFAGQDANRKIARALKSIAKEVKVVQLPADIKPKHGYDLSDYFLEHTAKDFRKLLRATPGTRSGPEEIDPTDVSVLESFDSRKVGDPMRLTVTIKGKHEPGYSIPHTVKLSCTRDYGDKCNFCPMNSAGGEDKIEIPPHDPLVMELMESERDKVLDMMRKRYGVPVKCPKLDIDVTKHQAVEVLFARPSVEHVNGSGNDAGDYKNIKITSVGRHSTMPNNTVTVLGSLQPDPRRQLNQFQAWEIAPIESGLDEFVLDKSTIRKLRKFQPRGGQSPLNKIGEIARELEEHVTYIYGRPEMHALMDLVWHSALAFNFGGRFERRGWLEALVIGDTRTGKSEAAARLSQHYSAGEIVTCESASFAGIVGGLQQYGAGKEWSVNWGVVPLNDRRLVVLDEVGGLEPDEIAQLSDVRSSGVAQLTKIQQERTLARTRLLWLGNPRNARMADFTYGVQAIRPLIGNSEDIARFDLAMSVKGGEVSPDTINRARGSGELKYDAESCGALIRWTWSRSPDSIVWGRGAERTVFKLAKAMGARYVEDPPLVQAANIRIKIARVAVAIAARTFSTDSTGEKLIVLPQHVKDAMRFMDILYSMRGFGYAERSSELIADRQKAIDAKQDVKKYLRTQAGLAKFLRGTGHFRRQDLEEILDVPREEANSIINKLWESRMVRKDKGNVVIEPTLHELLREVK